jgi:hypothetical protein
MKAFGASAPLKELQRKFGFDPEKLVGSALGMLRRKLEEAGNHVEQARFIRQEQDNGEGRDRGRRTALRDGNLRRRG